MKQKNKVSSRDVAREAGVSQATVSYVLNDVKGIKIKPETKEAVLNAAKKLNYYPNLIARGMKLNKSMSIGVVTNRDITSFYFMRTLEGIKDGIQQHNYSITLLYNKPADVMDIEYIKYYNSNRIDGIIFAFANLDNEAINYMNSMGIPFVIADAYPSGKDVHEVCTDHLARIPDSIEYFKSKGARRVGYISYEPRGREAIWLEAFKTAASSHGFEVNDDLTGYSDHSDDAMCREIMRLLRGEGNPDAILAGSPRFGLLTAKCAHELGMKIPEDLKIIALGSSNLYDLIYPRLSAVEVPLYDMGFRASNVLLDIMDGREVPRTSIVTSGLVIREST